MPMLDPVIRLNSCQNYVGVVRSRFKLSISDRRIVIEERPRTPPLSRESSLSNRGSFFGCLVKDVYVLEFVLDALLVLFTLPLGFLKKRTYKATSGQSDNLSSRFSATRSKRSKTNSSQFRASVSSYLCVELARRHPNLGAQSKRAGFTDLGMTEFLI